MDATVPERSTAELDVVEGNLRAGDHSFIRASQGSGVHIKGRAVFEGSVEVDCDFECESLDSRDGIIRVNGNLTVQDDIDVEEALYTRGNVKANNVDVGGRLSVGISLETRCADVGGSLEVQSSVEADSIDVGGSFQVLGGVKLKDLDVGGSADVGGGEVTGRIEAGGRFISRKEMKFDRIESGGTVELSGGAGRIIDVGGRLQSHGDLKCEEIEVGGLLSVEGSLTGRQADVGGMMSVSGDLGMTARLEIGGVAEIGGNLSGADVEVGGRLRASRGVLSGTAEIGGRVETKQGFKATKIEIGKGGSCAGDLVGGTIYLGRRAQVQDVYCAQLVVEGGSRLRRVYAESVDIGDDCVVGELVYTKELKEGGRVVHLKPPQKSESLPPFPL